MGAEFNSNKRGRLRPYDVLRLFTAQNYCEHLCRALAAEPQVLELLGQSHTFFDSDRPELIADHATSLDRPIAAETSQEASRAKSQLQAGLLAGWAH
jgi:hypothetical protein